MERSPVFAHIANWFIKGSFTGFFPFPVFLTTFLLFLLWNFSQINDLHPCPYLRLFSDYKLRQSIF